MRANPETTRGVTAASVPQAMTVSQIPASSSVLPRPSAEAPDAQAATTVWLGPVIAYRALRVPAAMLISDRGCRYGETISGPCRSNRRCWSSSVVTPPKADPSTMPTRLPSQLSGSSPA